MKNVNAIFCISIKWAIYLYECVFVWLYCIKMEDKRQDSEDEGKKPQKGHDNKSCPICGHGPYKDGRSVHLHITRYH